MLINNCNSDFVKWRGSRKCHIRLAMGKTVDYGYIPAPLSVYPWVLLAVLASKILIGNHHPHAMKCSGLSVQNISLNSVAEKDSRLYHPQSLKEMVESDVNYEIPVKRIALLEQINFAGKQRSCNRLTITCCWHRRPKKINIFHALPMISGRGSDRPPWKG
jgi:hypothetical protein